MDNRIKEIVAHYKIKYGTNDPFAISDNLGILYQFCNINFE